MARAEESVVRHQVPCRGRGTLADQPRGQYQRDHSDRRPRRATVAAVGFVRRRRAAQADLGRSRARPHRCRHRRGELDPDQRPRCAVHPGVGLHRGRRPDQVAVRRRRANALRRRLGHREFDRRRRPRGADHAGHGFRRCGKPGQVAGRRRRALALDGRHLHRGSDHRRRARSTEHAGRRASTDAASQVKSLAADVERSLSMAGLPPPKRSPPARAKRRARWSRRPPMRPTRSSR